MKRNREHRQHSEFWHLAMCCLTALMAGLTVLAIPVAAQADESDATVGVFYTAQLGTAGSTITGLPSGLVAAADGRVSGIPGQSGDYQVIVSYKQCSDDPGSDTQHCSIGHNADDLIVHDGASLGTLSATSGNGQNAAVGSTFTTALAAQLTDSRGAVASATDLTFTITQGSASFASGSSATATTDLNGIATAPALLAGSAAGPVVVTASQPGAAPASYLLTVTAAGPARADLVAGLTAPTKVSPNTSYSVEVTNTNHGPSPAAAAVTSLLLAPGVHIQSAPSAIRYGNLLVWNEKTLPAGSTAAHQVTLTDGPTDRLLLLSTIVASTTTDPDLRSNVSVKAIHLA